MGRHRRVADGANPSRRASTATGHGRHRGRRRRPAPVRTGLLGASAALAVGAVAVSSGLIPTPGGTVTVADPGIDDRVRTKEAGEPTTHGGTPSSPTARASRSAERDDLRSSAPPSKRPSTSAPPRSAGAGGASTATPSDTASPTPSRSTPDRPSRTPSDRPSPSESTDPGTGDGEGSGGDTGSGEDEGEATAQEAEVLRLVNAERAQAGCAPLTADPELAALARSHSADMADRGYFSHTTPDGQSPWDRASAAGVDNMGGENIARGQADAEAVLAAWMNSEGHRANILNCEFRTLGVGAHFAPGGPWWTQTFGY